MNIVEFIEELEYEKYTDTYHQTIINDCLTELHHFYGFNLDEWMFDELEVRFKNYSIPLLELVESISTGIKILAYDIDMTTHYIKECFLDAEIIEEHSDPRFFRFCGDIIFNDDLYIDGLLTVLEYFVVTKNRKNKWINIVRLYENLSSLKLLIKMNVNLMIEDQDIEKTNKLTRNQEYDKKPFNQKRIEVVKKHTFLQLKKMEALTITQCVAAIYKDVEFDLIAMFNNYEFPDEDKDYTTIPKAAFKRWVKQGYIEHYNLKFLTIKL